MAINQPIIVKVLKSTGGAKCQSPSLKLYMFTNNRVQTVPVGTNLALLQLMWTMLTGSFYKVAVRFSRLEGKWFSAEESRRIWRAFRQVSGVSTNVTVAHGTTMF